MAPFVAVDLVLGAHFTRFAEKGVSERNDDQICRECSAKEKVVGYPTFLGAAVARGLMTELFLNYEC